MISAAGFDWVDPRITAEHFPLFGRGKEERRLVLVRCSSWKRVVESKEVEMDVTDRGLWLARIEELLAFAAKYKDVVQESEIVALFSRWTNEQGEKYFPCLVKSENTWRFLASSDTFGWFCERMSFLAVR